MFYAVSSSFVGSDTFEKSERHGFFRSQVPNRPTLIGLRMISGFRRDVGGLDLCSSAILRTVQW
jgi:hypothetical protein